VELEDGVGEDGKVIPFEHGSCGVKHEPFKSYFRTLTQLLNKISKLVLNFGVKISKIPNWYMKKAHKKETHF